jgi:hypothetical protein
MKAPQSARIVAPDGGEHPPKHRGKDLKEKTRSRGKGCGFK